MFGPRQALEKQSCYFWRAEDENKPSPQTIYEQQPCWLQEISAKNRGRVKVAARAAAINGVVDRKKVNCQLFCYMIKHLSFFKGKCQIFEGSCFLNIRICCFSLSFMINKWSLVNEESLVLLQTLRSSLGNCDGHHNCFWPND